MDRLGDGWDPPQAIVDRVEFHWFHVDPGRSLVLGILSTAPMWYVGHFEGGRMRQCSGTGCLSCLKGVGAQIRYVFSAVELTTRQVGVIEVSKSVAELIRSWEARNGSLRGMVLEFQKVSRSKQSRMDVGYIAECWPSWCVTVAPLDLRDVLSNTWGRMEAAQLRKQGCKV